MQLLGTKKNLWLGISAVLMGLSILAIALWGLRLGLDFTGGTLLEVAHTDNKPVDQETLVARLKEVGVENIIAQQTGEGGVLIKAKSIEQGTHEQVNTILADSGLEEHRFENVGPTVGKDLTQKAIMAVVLASIAIILYIAYSFRNVPKPASSWRFGVTAVLALVHDIVFTVGIFAVLGEFLGYEVDALFITALLTIMGFSVHDTIVVFDRLRETMTHSPIAKPEQFEVAANDALVQTLGRSLNTSLTTMIVLLALALLGGESIRPFVVALLAGISIGTFSSIFTAVPALVLWQRWAMRDTTKRRLAAA